MSIGAILVLISQLVAAVASVIGAVLIPLLLFRFRQAGEDRQRQHDENKKALENRTKEIRDATLRIENHLQQRIVELGRKIDEHIEWHIRRSAD